MTDWNSGTPSGLVALPGSENRSLYLQGAGPPRRSSREPVIIIEHGCGGSRYEWLEVQRRVTQFARVYVYERAGYVPSSPWPSDSTGAEVPWTAKQVAHDLKGLLDAAGIAPPYILVGHSLGGLLVRRFLVEFGKDVVAGLVIVDAAVIRTALPSDFGELFGEAQYTDVLGISANHALPENEFELVVNEDERNNAIQKREFAKMDKEMMLLRDEISGRQLLGAGPLSVMFCDESNDAQKVYAHAVKHNYGSEATRKALAELLKDMSEVDEKSFRNHLSLTSNARFVKAQGKQCTHNVQLVDPGFVTKEIEWAWRECVNVQG